MKKRAHIYVIKLNKKLLLLIFIMLMIGVIAFLKNIKSYKVFGHKSNKTKTIVIDPGHGGIDGGTGSREDILEKDINLDVGLKLKKQLLVEGFEVIMTREKDESLEDLSDIKASRYRKDLDARKTIINQSNPVIFVSIHVNSSTKSKARGVKVYHYPTSIESKELAESICQSVNVNLYEKFLKDNTIIAETLFDDYYILRETKHTGALIEIGFITNPEDNRLLKDDEYKTKIALAIKKGIMKYIE